MSKEGGPTTQRSNKNRETELLYEDESETSSPDKAESKTSCGAEDSPTSSDEEESFSGSDEERIPGEQNLITQETESSEHQDWVSQIKQEWSFDMDEDQEKTVLFSEEIVSSEKSNRFESTSPEEAMDLETTQQQSSSNGSEIDTSLLIRLLLRIRKVMDPQTERLRLVQEEQPDWCICLEDNGAFDEDQLYDGQEKVVKHMKRKHKSQYQLVKRVLVKVAWDDEGEKSEQDADISPLRELLQHRDQDFSKSGPSSGRAELDYCGVCLLGKCRTSVSLFKTNEDFLGHLLSHKIIEEKLRSLKITAFKLVPKKLQRLVKRPTKRPLTRKPKKIVTPYGCGSCVCLYKAVKICQKHTQLLTPNESLRCGPCQQHQDEGEQEELQELRTEQPQEKQTQDKTKGSPRIKLEPDSNGGGKGNGSDKRKQAVPKSAPTDKNKSEGNKSAISGEERSSPEKKYGCDICNRTFRSRADLMTHERKGKCVKKKWECRICKKKLASSRGRIEHENRHEEPKEILYCPFCNKKFFNRGHCTMHARFCEKKRVLLCPFCNKQCKNEENLKDHMKLHPRPKKEFKCKFCGYKCKVEGMLRLHINRYHNSERQPDDAKNKDQGKSYKCNSEGCGKTFPDQNALEEHEMQEHLSQKSTSTESAGSYKIQDAVDDGSVQQPLPPEKKEPKFDCEFCHKSFDSFIEVDHHQKIFHLEEFGESSEAAEKSGAKRKHPQDDQGPSVKKIRTSLTGREHVHGSSIEMLSGSSIEMPSGSSIEMSPTSSSMVRSSTSRMRRIPTSQTVRSQLSQTVTLPLPDTVTSPSSRTMTSRLSRTVPLPLPTLTVSSPVLTGQIKLFRKYIKKPTSSTVREAPPEDPKKEAANLSHPTKKDDKEEEKK